MRTVNKVILIGNITRDPLYKTADGENKSEAEFHNCVAWWALADRAEQFLSKWKLVYIEWRLKTRVIEKDDGDKIYKTETVAGNMIFLNKRGEFEDNSSHDDSLDDDDMF